MNTNNHNFVCRQGIGVALLWLALALPLAASENVPRKPFAEWAELPRHKQFTIRLWYEEAEAYNIWAGSDMESIRVEKSDESYGIDRMQGIIAMEYGITERWAADLNIGYGTVGTRSFNPDASSESTSGLLDTSLGVRYQLFHEDGECWVPTTTFRAGAIIPGSFDQDFPFAPGQRSAGIEPSLLARKHFGWQGFGAYGDAFYRWMKTSGCDQYSVAVGFLQQIKAWEVNAGYRHFQQLFGEDLDFNGVGEPLEYSPQIREVYDALEAGFSYTTMKSRLKFGFFTRWIFDGSNTDNSFRLGGYFEIPIGGKK